jgi:hypothetical protein
MERDGKTYCDRHPNVETALRCSRCEATICPSCAVLTSVGYRCPDCGRERSATHTIAPAQFAIGSIVGFGLGFGCSYLIPNIFGFLILFIAVAVGGFVGQVVKRVIGSKSSVPIGAITALGFLGGAVARPYSQIAGANRSAGDTLQFIFANPWPIVFAALAAGVAWSQLR